MRAVGEPLTIEEVEVGAPGPSEVVVEVAAAGLCHSDLRFLEGSYPHPTPTVLGHECAGVVLEAGETVTHVRPGDHVIASHAAFCRTCSYCKSGRTHLCDNQQATRRDWSQSPRLTTADGEEVHQFLNLSSFAEQMLVHENTLVKINQEVPLDKAALLGCGAAAGLGAVFHTADVRPGESVAVIGCGGVGLSAIQGARIAGAGLVVAVDRVREKLALASKLGATHQVHSGETDPVRAVAELSAGGVDHAFEAIGSTVTAEQAFAMTRRGGTATIIGLIPAGQELSIPTDELYWERKIQGSVMGSNSFRTDTPRYLEMYMEGRLNLDDMVTGRLELSQINEGFEIMKTGKSARSVILFDPAS